MKLPACRDAVRRGSNNLNYGSPATADQILPMVKSDLGIGFVPVDFLKKENMENLVILNMKPAIPSRNICILKRKGMSLSVAASELESLL